jgi:integrase-like protein
MTKLRDRMMGELQLRHYSEHRIYSYIGSVERFARHFGKSPTELGADHVKQFLLFLKNEKKVVWQTVQANRVALRFLYVSVLKQKWFEEEIPLMVKLFEVALNTGGFTERGHFYECGFHRRNLPGRTVRERSGTFWDPRKQYSVTLTLENNIHQPNAGESYTWSNLTIRG